MEAFMSIAFTGTCLAIAYLLVKVTIVLPAWKQYRIQRAKTTLSKCINRLNSDTLPQAKIRNGHYLHDKFYKLIFAVYTSGSPKIVSTTGIKHDEKTERNRRAFRSEIEKLDNETKAIIDDSMLAISQILFFNNPLSFPLLFIKSTREMSRFNRANMVRNAEYLTVSDKKDVISFQEQCHA